MTERTIENSKNKEIEDKTSYDDEAIDFLKILLVMGEQKLTIFIITLLAIFIGIYICYTTPATYIAKTSIVPSNNASNMALNMNGLNLNGLNAIASIAGLMNNSSGKTNEAMLIAYMRSRQFQANMVNSLNLIERLRVKDLNEAINQINSNLDIGMDKKSGLMIIGFANTNPELAAILVNEVVVALKNHLRQIDFENVAEKRALYVKHIIDIRKKLPQLESDYRNAERVAGISASNYYIAQGNLPSQIANKELQIQMQLKFVTFDNPEIKKLNTELQSLKEQLKNQQLSNINAINNTLIDKKNKNLNSKNDTKSELIFEALQLYSSFKIQESILQGINQQLEIMSTDDIKMSLSQIQIIDKAEVPLNRSKPEKSKIMIIFTSVGFLIAILIAFIKHKITTFLIESKNSEKLIQVKQAWRL
jgi:tyrosine-protein kinase Etk/Wzc